MFDEKQEKFDFWEKDAYQSQSYLDKPSDDTYYVAPTDPGKPEQPDSRAEADEEDLQLLLNNAAKYIANGEIQMAQELYLLAVDMDEGCAQAWIGLLELDLDRLKSKKKNPFFLDDQAWKHFENADACAEGPQRDQLDKIAADAYHKGMTILRDKTQNATYFKSHSTYHPDSVFVDRMFAVAVEAQDEEELDNFVRTYRENYTLFLQLQEQKKNNALAMIKKDPGYVDLVNQCDRCQERSASMRTRYSGVEFWHYLLAVAGVAVSFWGGSEGLAADLLPFTIHLIPALISVVLFFLADVMWKPFDDSEDHLIRASIPAAVLYLALEYLVYVMAHNAGSTAKWTTMLLGILVVLYLAVIGTTIFLFFVSFWGAIIFGAVGFGILNFVQEWLAIDSIYPGTLYAIRSPIFILLTLLCAGMLALLIRSSIRSSQSYRDSDAAAVQLKDAEAARDQYYADKVAQLKAPYVGHVAACYLEDMTKVDR